ncbi:MAG: hypothetical protein R2856_06850 [Caldilineaceae bacterium]
MIRALPHRRRHEHAGGGNIVSTQICDAENSDIGHAPIWCSTNRPCRQRR